MNIVDVGIGRVDEHHSQLSHGAPSQSYGEATPIKRAEEGPGPSVVEPKRNLYSQIFDASSVLMPLPSPVHQVGPEATPQVDIPTGGACLPTTMPSEAGIVAATGLSQLESTRLVSLHALQDGPASKDALPPGPGTLCGPSPSGYVSPS